MSLENDLGLSEEELKEADPTVRDRVMEKYARLKGLFLLQSHDVMERDSERLDAKARATYKLLGAGVRDQPAGKETVLGDKQTTINHHQSSNKTGLATALGLGAVGAGLGLYGLTRPNQPVQPTTPVVEAPTDPVDGNGNIDTDTDSVRDIGIWVPPSR